MREYNIKYQIPTYEIIKSRLKKLEQENATNKYQVKNVGPIAYSSCGVPLDHYQIGHGPIHINVVGGTHGNEIITADFVTQFMRTLAKGEGEFKDFNEDEYTIDIIPIQNPEAFIISTCGINAVLGTLPASIVETFSKTYWAAFREADILSRANKDLPKTAAFAYQTMFEKADYKSIIPAYPYEGETQIEYEIRKDVYKKIRESVKSVVDNYPEKMPPGYPVYWQATANGVNLNANNPFNINSEREREIAKKRASGEDFEHVWGPARYSNILKYVPGPIGVSSSDPEKNTIEPENRALFNLIDEQIKNHQYGGLISFHGTGGIIYNRPSAYADNEIIDTEKRYHIAGINQAMAKIYKSKMGYTIGEDGENKNLTITDPDFLATDELLRVTYPGVLLVELSKMGGNPIAPYGDYLNNYIPTICGNISALAELIKRMKDLHPYIEDPNSLIIPGYDPETMEDKPLSR